MSSLAAPTRPDRPAATLPILLALAAWAALVVAAAGSGALAALGRVAMPAYALLVVLGIALPLFAWQASAPVREAVDRLGLHRLTLVHAWRIPAALLFLEAGLDGRLPPLFWILAGTGDLLAGAWALSVLRGPRDLARYRRIHLFGLADFVLAVGTGLAFTLLGDPRMATLTTLPMALIPLFGVGLSGASHVVALLHLAPRRAG